MSIVTFSYYSSCGVCSEAVDPLSPWAVAHSGVLRPIHSACQPEAEEGMNLTTVQVHHRMMDQYTGPDCGTSLYVHCPETGRSVLIERGVLYDNAVMANGKVKTMPVDDSYGAELISAIETYWANVPAPLPVVPITGD